MKPKHALLITLALAIASCAAPHPSWLDKPNPLDTPGEGGLPDAEQLHRENIREITGNKAYELHEELSADWAANNS